MVVIQVVQSLLGIIRKLGREMLPCESRRYLR